jgi:anti-sigma factor RsiW
MLICTSESYWHRELCAGVHKKGGSIAMVSSKLTCRELVELVTDYFEAALSPGDYIRFEVHLAGCAACRDHVEQMRQTIQIIGMLSEDMIPAHVQSELLELFRGWKQHRV